MKKLKASASDFIIDESDNRLYAIGSKINVFDLTTLKKIGSVSGFRYLTAVCLVRKHGIMFAATNNGECWTVSPGDYTKIKRFRVGLHDSNVYYDESEDKVYIVGYNKNCKTEAAVYDCKKDEMRSLRFVQCEEDGEVVRYSLNKCIDGYLYLYERSLKRRTTLVLR